MEALVGARLIVIPMIRRQHWSILLALVLALCGSVGGDGRHSKLYETLGVEPTANEQQIKKAYRKRSMEWHPDKNAGNEELAQVRQYDPHPLTATHVSVSV